MAACSATMRSWYVDVDGALEIGSVYNESVSDNFGLTAQTISSCSYSKDRATLGVRAAR